MSVELGTEPEPAEASAEARIDDSEFYFAMVPEELIFSELSDAAVRVYAAIQRLGRSKDAKVTYRTIGERLGAKLGPKAKRANEAGASGMSDAKVKRAIMELEKAGWLTVKRRRGPLGHNLPSVYRPLLSQATGLVSGQVTSELRTIPSGVTSEPRVEPKLTSDPMPKLTGDPMPKVTSDPSIDSSFDRALKREGAAAGQSVPSQPQFDLDCPTGGANNHQAAAESLCQRLYVACGYAEPFEKFKARTHRKVWARDWLAPALGVVKVEGDETIDAILAFLASGERSAVFHAEQVIDAKTLATHCNRFSLSSKANAWAAKRARGSSLAGPQAPDSSTALAIVEAAFSESRRPGSASVDEILATQHPALQVAFDAVYQSFRTKSKESAGWDFKAAYTAALTKTPTTTGPMGPNPKEAA